MAQLQALKAAQTLRQLAPFLECKPQHLSYLLYILPKAEKYTTFDIPKKAGGVRTINAPIGNFKKLQKRLADLLYDCRDEIEAIGPKRKSLSHGFRRKHSIVTNARKHTGRRYVLNLDLRDFFPTFNFGRVRGFFLRNQHFSLQPKIATLIAQIACYDDGLPQGSPCSPIISDLIAHILDVRLVRLAKLNRCTYSRYADDITFSTNQKDFPPALARENPYVDSEWMVSVPLREEIERAGFTINENKTRMQYRVSRQLVTGLTVNKKANIRSEYYRRTRQMCHSLFQKEFYHDGDQASNSVSTLEGMVGHIYHIKKTADPWSEKPMYERQAAAYMLYRKLLFFKHFVDLPKPLVVCEGKTDGLYLRAAIKRLPAFHPMLAEKGEDGIQSKIKFFRYTKIAEEVLDLTGGTGDLSKLIAGYENFSKYYSKVPKSPVLVLIDNDSGASPVLRVVKNKFGKVIELTSPEEFHHLCRNLYLIKTPELGTDGVSSIEDFFDAQVLATKLDGKSFNPSNFQDSATEYGKFLFAEKVVSPNSDKINFANFAVLLSRIVAAIQHYTSQPNAN